MPVKSTIPVGTRFGRLTVLGESPQRKGSYVAWGCRCDCGMIVIVAGANLRFGDTLSCGCLLADKNRDRLLTHGLTDSIPEYKTWCSMRGRCLNPNNRQYPNYGGRGITICPEWDDFAVFYRDMGSKPSPVHTIDRIDNDRGYAPDNCRWASPTEQSRNRRITRRLTWQGQARSLGEWVEITGIPYGVISRRLIRGWTVEETLTVPLGTRLRNDGFQLGEAHHEHVLSVEQVATARKLAARGGSVRQMASEWGVSYRTLLSAVNGDTWQWLTDPPTVKLGRGPQHQAGL